MLKITFITNIKNSKKLDSDIKYLVSKLTRACAALTGDGNLVASTHVPQAPGRQGSP